MAMIGSSELLLILVAALFLFGPTKLPELAKSLGSAFGEFKKAQLAAELGFEDSDFTSKASPKPGAEEGEDDPKKANTREVQNVLVSGPSGPQKTAEDKGL